MKKFKKISNKRFRTLNAKSNQVGLDTHELLQVLEKMVNQNMHNKWKNPKDDNGVMYRNEV